MNHKVASNFSDCFQNIPDPQLKDMEIYDDAFMSEELLTRSNGEDPDSNKQEIDAECDNEEFGDVNHESEVPLDFPISPITNIFAGVCEQDSNEEDVYEEVNEMDLVDYWDITVEDDEKLEEILTTTMFNEPNPILEAQPLTSPITAPDDNYETPTTNPILDELLMEFGDELLDTTMIDEEAGCDPAKDVELEPMLYEEHLSFTMDVEVSMAII